jgi:hypothetical protein
MVKVDKSCEMFVRFDIYAAAPAAVAAVRPALWHAFLAPERGMPVASFAGYYPYLHVIYEHNIAPL